jgi:hypothetical protein
MIMEMVFIGLTEEEANRKADEWWGQQEGARQIQRTLVAVGQKGPGASGIAKALKIGRASVYRVLETR